MSKDKKIKEFYNYLKANSPSLQNIDVDKWPTTNTNDLDRTAVIEELAKKFVNKKGKAFNSELKLRVNTGFDSYSSAGLEYPDTDGATQYNAGYPSFSFMNQDNTAEKHPNLNAVGHELLHANDHQFDGLNSKMLGHLKNLASSLGSDKKAQSSFEDSIKKIQNKIDPTTIFASEYKWAFDKANKVKNAYKADLEGVKRQLPATNLKRNENAWPEFLSQMKTDAEKYWGSENHPTFTSTEGEELKKAYSNQPQIFFDNILANGRNVAREASEFPAFASERLHQSWKTADNTLTAALNLAEQEVLHSMLTDIEIAYPVDEYPEINTHARARKNSIEDTDIWKKIAPTQAAPSGGLGKRPPVVQKPSAKSKQKKIP